MRRPMTPRRKSGGGSLLNKACHPLGPALYLKQMEGILLEGQPIRPARVSAVALQVLKQQPSTSHEHFRVMQHVDDYARVTVVFEDGSVAELFGYDLSIGGTATNSRSSPILASTTCGLTPAMSTNCSYRTARRQGVCCYARSYRRTGDVVSASAAIPHPRLRQRDERRGRMRAARGAVSAIRADDGVDTLAVLMAGYESAAKGSEFVDITEYTRRPFPPETFRIPTISAAFCSDYSTSLPIPP